MRISSASAPPPPPPGEAPERATASTDPAGEEDSPAARVELSDEAKETVRKMAARDAEVRTHEQAHKAVGGGLTGSIHYDTEKGPDGKDYAVGGHVPIDTSPGSTPEETLEKAGRIKAAALAPAQPSAADKAVASKASQMAADARAELSAQASEEAEAARAEDGPEGTEEPGGTGEEPDTQAEGAEGGPDPRPGPARRRAAAYARWS